MTLRLWDADRGRMGHAVDRLRAAAVVRADRVRSRWSAPRPVDRHAGPVFTVSGFDASFEELARILDHPQVKAQLQPDPPAPLSDAEAPMPEWPVPSEPFLAPRREVPSRVYDVVPLAFELDMLELRLLTLDRVVDRFVVVESASAFGGVGKGVRFDPASPRFQRFADRIVHVVLPAEVVTGQYPDGRRRATDFRGEDAFRAAMWRAVRDAVSFEPDALVISADLDELPPPGLIDWLRHHAVDLPWRLDLASLRYSFCWRDRATPAQLVLMSPKDFALVDEAPHRMRHVPGRLVGATGAVHLTSFLMPLALIAKFAMTTDWDPGILPFLRNEHDETARMMAEGRWFSRRLTPYDADRDPEGLVPWAARAHRARFANFWQLPAFHP